MRIGWIGFGEMGGRIVHRLLDQGQDVVGWNRTASKTSSHEPLGLIVAASPRAVAEQATIVFSMLTDTAAVRECVLGEDGILAGLAPGSTIVEMSTIDPQASRALADEVRAAGSQLLDCPVSGGVGAVAGREIIGKRVTHVGENGQALVMKIAINLSLAVQMIAFSEGVLLAEKSGITREKAVEAMVNSAIASPMIRHRGPAVLRGALPDPAWFDCSMMQKDLLLAMSLGRERTVPLPTTALANEWMTACRGSGVGEEDFSVVFHVLARLAGVGDGDA